MNETDFQLFIKLVKIDQDINELNSDKIILSREKETLEQNLKELQDSVIEASSASINLKKQIDAQELELKVYDEQMSRKKEKLENVGSPKEYTSLEHEIDVLKERIAINEDELFRLWQRYEKAQENYQVISQNQEEKIKLIEAKIKIILDRLETIEIRFKDLTLQRPRYENQVNPEILEVYNSIRAQAPNAAVPVRRNSCSACFHIMSTPDLIAVRRHELVRCKNCYRLLYSDEPE